METQGLKKKTDKAIANVKRMADEIKLEIHLAGMDAKDAWKKLEPRIAMVEKLAEDAVEDLDAKVTALRHSLKKDVKH